jgi:catechol 2,3-dioxygenase-like lactoylglutathione lyase family enzyme
MNVITHVGIAVPQLDPAVSWFRDVLGFEPLGETTRVRENAGHAGMVAADVLGPGFGSFSQAHLAGDNGVALELFQFNEPQEARRGIFHICLVARDVPRTAQRIAANGGRQTSRVWHIFEDEPYLTCYCEDPFGNVLELYSHSHERVYSNRGAAG